MTERLRYPGYRGAAGSTHDWTRKVSGPFVWVRYTAPDDEGMSDRTEGFTPTWGAAVREALANAS